MYFISEPSTSSYDEVYGTLIGVYNGYLYSGNSFEDDLNIFRKRIFDTGDWEHFWDIGISNRNDCGCINGVSVAYGIIEDELYVAAYGLKHDDVESKFYLSSICLASNIVIDYKTDVETRQLNLFKYALCNDCNLSQIISNPTNPNEIIISLWYPDSGKIHNSRDRFFATSCHQIKLSINKNEGSCIIPEAFIFVVSGNEIKSNIGSFGFGKVVYFRNGELVLPGDQLWSDRKLTIVDNSDLKNCISAGFYNTPSGLQCLTNEASEDGRDRKVRLYDVKIDESNLQAKFIHKMDLPSFPSPSDFRYSKFFLDSRMLIYYNNGYIFTLIFGMLSLTETSYLSLSNSSSSLHCVYEEIVHSKKELKDFRKLKIVEHTLGFTQNDIKDALKIPSSCSIIRVPSEIR